MDDSTTKKCTKCNQDKPLSAFGKDISKRDGLNCHCRACRRLVDTIRRASLKNDLTWRHKRRTCSALWYSKHREARRQRYTDVYYANLAISREKGRHAWHKRNARKLCAGGTFTDHDVKRQGECQRWRCWWCGKPCANEYHIDHLVPLARGGHNNPSNIVISCPHCNLSKSDKMPDEFAGILF